jgi:hypothetical protein
MTQYRRKAGPPVDAHKIGSEPVPRWAEGWLRRKAIEFGRSYEDAVSAWTGDVLTHKGDVYTWLPAAEFARDYEPVPAEPDVREALAKALGGAVRAWTGCPILRCCPPDCCAAVSSGRPKCEQFVDSLVDAALARMEGKP